MNIELVSTFGPSIRGVSPYADSLSKQLEKQSEHTINRHDFSYLYPPVLSPTDTHHNEIIGTGISILSPKTWKAAVNSDSTIIHLQYWTFLTLVAYLGITKRAKRLCKPVCITVHNPTHHETLPFIRKLERSLYTHATAIIVHTLKAKKILQTAGVPSEKINVIPHGANVRYHPPPPSHQKQLLFFGNIRSYKGLDTLLAAWDLIKLRHPSYTLVIAGRLWSGKTLKNQIIGLALGSNKIRKAIEERIKANDSQLEFRLGFIPEIELNQLIRISRFCVFPYKHFESQSGAALKAASTGIPIIVTDCGGLPELAPNKELVAKADNPESLANSLSFALNISDDQVWSSLSKKQIAITKLSSWQSVADLHLQLFDRLV